MILEEKNCMQHPISVSGYNQNYRVIPNTRQKQHSQRERDSQMLCLYTNYAMVIMTLRFLLLLLLLLLLL